MNKRDKIQCLLITYLMEKGQINLVLPDGMNLSLGITTFTKSGIQKEDNYCWLEASQDARQISLDSHNLDFQFGKDRLVFRNDDEDNICSVSVV